MITLWGGSDSTNVQKALWTLDELGLAYQSVDIGGEAGGLDAPEFRAMNPHGLVPVLRDGEATIWESNTIVRYLCAAYSPDGLCPTDPGRRAVCEAWMDWTLAALYPAISGLFWTSYQTPAPQRDPARVATLARQSARAIETLDRWLSDRPFVTGDVFSMADIPAGVLVYRYFELDVSRPEAPAVQAWRRRLGARPAYASHVMRPFG